VLQRPWRHGGEGTRPERWGEAAARARGLSGRRRLGVVSLVADQSGGHPRLGGIGCRGASSVGLSGFALGVKRFWGERWGVRARFQDVE